jgi:stage V sporulation protein AA
MNRALTPTLYVRLRKRFAVLPGQLVKLGDVAQLSAAEPEMERKLRELVLARPAERDGNLMLIDMMQVVRLIHSVYPGVQVEHFGEPHTLVEVTSAKKAPNRLLLAAVWILLFIGSGLAIMNFHVDVSMMSVHQRLYEMITGQKAEHPYWLQIPYSIGLGFGMMLFFNQLFKKKFNEEPSPLELEMFSYQENMNQYIITEEYRKMHAGTATTAESADGEAAEEGKRNGEPQ